MKSAFYLSKVVLCARKLQNRKKVHARKKENKKVVFNWIELNWIVFLTQMHSFIGRKNVYVLSQSQQTTTTGWLLLHSSRVNFYFYFCFSYPLVCCAIYFCHSFFSSASASLVDCYFPHRLDGDPDRLIVLIMHQDSARQCMEGSIVRWPLHR